MRDIGVKSKSKQNQVWNEGIELFSVCGAARQQADLAKRRGWTARSALAARAPDRRSTTLGRTHPLSTITTSRGILTFHFLAPVYWRFNQEETGWSNFNIRRHFILSAKQELNLDENTNGGQRGELVLSLWSMGGAFCFPVSPLRDVVFSGVSINAVLLTWNKMGGLADWAAGSLHYTG